MKEETTTPPNMGGATAPGHKCGFAALVGGPNVGKSTLVNALVGEKVAATSAKAQTTRDDIRAILTRDDAQIVFIDTPGMTPPHKRHPDGSEYSTPSMPRRGRVPHHLAPSVPEADVVLWLVEASRPIGLGERHILSLLEDIKTPVILVVNKIDAVSWERLLAIIDAYRRERDFAEIVPVSAYEGENLDELVACVIGHLPAGPPLYDSDVLTDQRMQERIEEIIREKALHALRDEVPHQLVVSLDVMELRDGIFCLEIFIYCPRKSHVGIIIGKNGAMIKQISSTARYEIERLLQARVYLRIWVKEIKALLPWS
ncbi:MAG: GTPase Era [Lachnospiraceae bacterium]|nr:GTPase Era [Lachnospiraceae bacterium]